MSAAYSYSMAATRTQIYLTQIQRRRLDEMCRIRGVSLAEVVREAVDRYLVTSGDACAVALDDTFGQAPDIDVPARDEWERGGRESDAREDCTEPGSLA